MQPFRTHAYEVSPQRLADKVVKPIGGSFSADADFRLALDRYFVQSKLSSQAQVDFRLKNTKTTATKGPDHSIRSNIIDYCFGANPTAKTAAVSLATALSESMDHRSPFTLLMLIAYKRDDGKSDRRIVMWAFPKDEPLQFKSRNGRTRITVPSDIFSRSSSFRKGALFEGENKHTHFLQGRVIDKQAQDSANTAAAYWVSGFLDCRFSLNSTAGTRLLANVLRKTYEYMTNRDDKDNITNAIVGLHSSQRQRWSLDTFATEFLKGDTKARFLKETPPEAKSVKFTLDRTEFSNRINYRLFRLEDDVMVSAPFGTIGESVTISGGKVRKLKVEGIVAEEKVRSKRYAG